MPLLDAKLFFESFAKTSSVKIEQIPQSGSSRSNFIGQSEKGAFIVTQNENIQENEAFIYLSEKFSELGLNTPKIIAINKERNIYIQQFLGKNTLSELIEKNGHTPETKLLVQKTLELLFVFQQKTRNKIDFSKTFEYEKYDDLPITHDLYYFKNFLVDLLEIPYHKSTLLKEFKNIVRKIEHLQPQTIMMRDFQARNILVDKDRIFFIDYQSAMQGPAMYDVVSFLFQAKANFPTEWKTEMLEFYLNLWDKDAQKQLCLALHYCQLIRFLQVLGAYGFRGIIQKKLHFMASIKQGIENLHLFFESWEESNHFPELHQIVKKLNNYQLNF